VAEEARRREATAVRRGGAAAATEGHGVAARRHGGEGLGHWDVGATNGNEVWALRHKDIYGLTGPDP
jgi:hypothetical protein